MINLIKSIKVPTIIFFQINNNQRFQFYRSMILSRRPNDDDRRDGFTKWPFMTTHTWGEYPRGEWTLEVINNN